MSTPRTRRPHAGFTLIELLVVISLIGILAALSAGAFMRVRASQIKSNSEATLVKLNTALDNRWKTIQESVNEDARKNQGQWSNALATANQNTDIAKSLLLYAKVKNELPMTFAEARNPTTVGAIYLQPRANFKDLPASGPGSPEESAVCFFVAVTTSGGGGAILDGEGLQQQTADSTNFAGQKFFKDALGLPIAFVRQAYTAEVDQPPFVRNGSATSKDPFDPAGKLTNFMTANPGVWTSIVSNAPGFANIPASYQGNRNFVPTLVSAGPDKKFTTPTADIFAGSDNDNLLSYRLRREGARGD